MRNDYQGEILAAVVLSCRQRVGSSLSILISVVFIKISINLFAATRWNYPSRQAWGETLAEGLRFLRAVQTLLPHEGVQFSGQVGLARPRGSYLVALYLGGLERLRFEPWGLGGKEVLARAETSLL